MSKASQTIEHLQQQMDRITSSAHQESAAFESAGNDVDGTASGDFESAELRAVRAAALRLLNTGPRSREQLRLKLLDNDHDAADIEAILQRFEAVDLIDDAAYAQQWVRRRSENKNLAAMRLRRELEDKGIAEEHIEAALEQLSGEDQEAAARRIIDEKLKNQALPAAADSSAQARRERDKVIRRLLGVLQRRGHQPATALNLIQEALQENGLD